jgi:hypothetical protein
MPPNLFLQLSRQPLTDEAHLKVLFGIKERERSTLNGKVDALIVSPALDFVEEFVNELKGIVGVVFEPQLRQHVAQACEPDTDPSFCRTSFFLLR